ncbi:MAG TPA: response regulator, partial [Pseudomonadales bacterium]|nr:response regulator [Pseudomonadales bacterium]
GGLDVVEAADGAEAWEILCHDNSFLLCCFDVRMPNLNGMDLVKKMRTDLRFKYVPVLLITSVAEKDAILAASKLNVAGYLVKPVEAEQAIPKINATLKRAESDVLLPFVSIAERLKINQERYGKYLGAFLDQFESTIIDLEKNDPSELKKSGIIRLDQLRTACITLGATQTTKSITDIEEYTQKGVVPDATMHAMAVSVLKAELTRLRARIDN